MKDNFNVDEKGQLTKDGFLQMYHMQTEGGSFLESFKRVAPEETWADLQKLGYDRSFKLSLTKQ